MLKRSSEKLVILCAVLLGGCFTPRPEYAVNDALRRLVSRDEEKRDEAFQIGVLLKKPDDKVPATVRIGSTAVKVKVRLKGDIPDHLRLQ